MYIGPILEPSKLLRTEIAELKICPCAAAVDNQQSRTSLAANFAFNLTCRPKTAVLSEAEIRELLDRARYLDGFLYIYRKANAVVQPSLHLGIVRAVGAAGRALRQVAIASANHAKDNGSGIIRRNPWGSATRSALREL
jgi:hypothetical protein